MAGKAEIGLVFDLSQFRSGIRKASRIVKKGLGDSALSPFNKAIRKTARNISKRIGGAIRGIRKALFSLKTVIGGLLIGLGLNKVKDAVLNLVGAFKSIKDEVKGITALAKNNPLFNPGDIKKVTDEARKIALALGLNPADVIRGQKVAVTKGFSPGGVDSITRVASILAQQFGTPVEDAVMKLSEALEGQGIDPLSDFGINPTQIQAMTEDAVQQGQIAFDMLAEMVRKVKVDDIMDSFDKFTALMAEVRIKLGKLFFDKLTPLMDKLNSFLEFAIQTGRNSAAGRLLESVIDKAIGFIEGVFVVAKNIVVDFDMIKRIVSLQLRTIGNAISIIPRLITDHLMARIRILIASLAKSIASVIFGTFRFWINIYLKSLPFIMNTIKNAISNISPMLGMAISGPLKKFENVINDLGVRVAGGRLSHQNAKAPPLRGSLTKFEDSFLQGISDFIGEEEAKKDIGRLKKTLGHLKSTFISSMLSLGHTLMNKEGFSGLPLRQSPNVAGGILPASQITPQSALATQAAQRLADQEERLDGQNERIVGLLSQINGNLAQRQNIIQLSENRPSYYRTARPVRRRR